MRARQARSAPPFPITLPVLAVFAGLLPLLLTRHACRDRTQSDFPHERNQYNDALETDPSPFPVHTCVELEKQPRPAGNALPRSSQLLRSLEERVHSYCFPDEYIDSLLELEDLASTPTHGQLVYNALMSSLMSGESDSEVGYILAFVLPNNQTASLYHLIDDLLARGQYVGCTILAYALLTQSSRGTWSDGERRSFWRGAFSLLSSYGLLYEGYDNGYKELLRRGSPHVSHPFPSFKDCFWKDAGLARGALKNLLARVVLEMPVERSVCHQDLYRQVFFESDEERADFAEQLYARQYWNPKARKLAFVMLSETRLPDVYTSLATWIRRESDPSLQIELLYNFLSPNQPPYSPPPTICIQLASELSQYTRHPRLCGQIADGLAELNRPESLALLEVMISLERDPVSICRLTRSLLRGSVHLYQRRLAMVTSLLGHHSEEVWREAQAVATALIEQPNTTEHEMLEARRWLKEVALKEGSFSKKAMLTDLLEKMNQEWGEMEQGSFEKSDSSRFAEQRDMGSAQGGTFQDQHIAPNGNISDLQELIRDQR